MEQPKSYYKDVEMKHYLLHAMLVCLWSISFASAEEPVGWRANGSGNYASATPPRTWTVDKNVAWRTKMPGRSNASPIVVGDKVFVCSEPSILLCVNAADGRLLWQKEHSYQDIVLSAKVKEKLALEQTKADEIRKQIHQVEMEMSVLHKKLKANPDSKDDVKSQNELKVRTKALKDKLKDFPLDAKFRMPKADSAVGYSTPTPTSDGKHVFVAFGNGLVACYDLEGKRNWIQLIEHSTVGYGHSASPLLIGNKLLIHYTDLVALDVKDGSECWRTKLSPSHGSPIHAKNGTTDVAITPNGQLIKVADGKVLADHMGHSGPNSPIVQDGIVYFVQPETRAVKLPADLSASAKPEMLWKCRLKGGGYWFASPVCHAGLIYGINEKAILSVVDAQTGKLVYDQRLPLGKGAVYPSITLAGGFLFISSDAGVTLVLEPGREYKQVGKNSLEGFRSTPVFQGKRMFVRGMEHLYCIAE